MKLCQCSVGRNQYTAKYEKREHDVLHTYMQSEYQQVEQSHLSVARKKAEVIKMFGGSFVH